MPVIRAFLTVLLLLLSSPGVLAAPESAPAADTAADTGAESAAEQLRSEAAALVETLEAERAQLKQRRQDMQGKTGEELDLLVRQAQDEELLLAGTLHDLAELVIKAREQDIDLGPVESQTVEWMRELPDGIDAALQRRQERRDERMAELETAPPEKLLEAEQKLAAANASVDEVLRYYAQQIDLLERLGLDASRARDDLLSKLHASAETTSTRIELTQEEITKLRGVLAGNPGDSNISQRLQILDERMSASVSSLQLLIEQLKLLGGDTTEYQKLLVLTTGDVSAIGLNAGVLVSLLGELVTSVGDWFSENLAQIVAKLLVLLLILAITWLLAALAKRLAARALRATRANVSQLLQKMLISLTGKVIAVLGLLVALSQFGISVGPMLAGLGIAGFIIGFALQDTLSNFASGAMILFYRPFDVGDVVEAAGITGKVSAMNLVSTTVLTFDNQTLIVPNNKIWGDVIRNVTHQTKRRVDMKFGIGYSDDVDKAERILHDIVTADARILADPEPLIKLHELGESSVNFAVRPWVYTADYWDVYWDITREVKRRFDAEGITIPFPQRDVHHYYKQLPPEMRAQAKGEAPAG